MKKVAYECMRALCDYEGLSLVHKDVKLENVVLMDTGKRGVLKVIDFDTVEEYGDDTRVYDVMGTDQYIAPESYYGYYTTASDIFALGSPISISSAHSSSVIATKMHSFIRSAELSICIVSPTTCHRSNRWRQRNK